MQFAAQKVHYSVRKRSWLVAAKKVGEQACKPDSVPRQAGVEIIPLGRRIAPGL